jgi:hypothetical protein
MFTTHRQRWAPPARRRACGWPTVGVAAALLGPLPPARADTSSPLLRTGAPPIAVAVDPGADKIYFANYREPAAVRMSVSAARVGPGRAGRPQ